MALDDIVSVTITSETAAVTQQGFGIPMIMSAEAQSKFGERARSYDSITAVGNDGFSVDGPTYIAAQKLFGQVNKPEKIIIGRRANLPTQVTTLTPIVKNLQAYTVVINGTPFIFTSDANATAAEIVTGLSAAINGGTEPVTASGTTTLILTADVAGELFTLETDRTLLTQVTSTPDPGVVADLNAIRTAQDGNDEWYNLILDSKGKAEQLALMAAIETTNRMFSYATADDDAVTGAGTNVLDSAKTANYKRSFGQYHPKATSQQPDAGWVGACAPLEPGSETWKFKAVAGADFVNLTSTEATFLKNKNGNYQRREAGQSFMTEGVVASGEFIDITRLNDAIVSGEKEGVFGDLIRNGKKIPFTDKGGTGLAARVKSVLKRFSDEGGTGGLIDSSISVVAPKVEDISTNDRAIRKFRTIKFSANYASAVHSVGISGTLSI